MCNTYTTVLLILLWFNDLLVSIFFCLFYLHLFIFSLHSSSQNIWCLFSTRFFIQQRNKNTNKILFKRFKFIWIQCKCTAEHLLNLEIFGITTTNMTDKKFVFFYTKYESVHFFVKRFAWKRNKTNLNYSWTVSSGLIATV